MDYLYLLLGKLLCLSSAIFIFYLLHLIDGNALLELGYRPAAGRRMRKQERELPKWDQFLHWTMTRLAKFQSVKLWFYWGLHVFAVLGLCVSVVLFFLPIPISDWRSRMSVELYCPIVTFIAHTGIRIVIDLLVLPSEQKRYGIRKKTDKR